MLVFETGENHEVGALENINSRSPGDIHAAGSSLIHLAVMPITPQSPAGPKVDVNLREHLSFNPASQETLQRTNLAKSFLEDYYKHIPTRPPKSYVYMWVSKGFN